MIARTTSAAAAGTAPSGVLARLRDDRGSVLLESLIFTAVIALVILGFASVAVTAGKAQRVAQTTDIAAQAAHGIIEQAKATPFDELGFDPSTDGYPGDMTPYGPTVRLSVPPTYHDPVAPVETKTVRGLNVSLTTQIVWATTSPRPVKAVVVTADWESNGRLRTETYSSYIAPTVAEVPPGDVPEGGL